ncbi:MAG: MATE family efflux transporter [Eubacteriales bacterium]|nr:MATE family efflux transporter [Eubacteriales bacterium]
MQLGSIISIFIAGICDGAVPVYSLLYGADDRQGIKLLTKKGLMLLEICSVGLIVLFVFFPGILLRIFGIESALQQSICIRAIRTFAIYAPFRSALVFYRVLLNAGGKIKYASTIAVLDSIIGITAFSYLGSAIWKIDGLWYAYIMNLIVIIILMVIYNIHLYHKSQKKISPFYLLSEEPERFMLDLTILSDEKEFTQLSENAVACCKENGFSDRISTFAGLLIEEMAAYTRNHCGEHQYLDILMKKEESGIKIDFRSIGKPFNPLVESEQDPRYNVDLLNKLVNDIHYVYAMGLNTTSIILKEK